MNYEEDQLDRVFLAARAAAEGTALHALAADLIRHGIRLEDQQRTMNMYVNDCIGHRMTPEQILFYSDNCFGTADAISFRKLLLRISDLKTGVSKTSVKQLEIYAALFCLEYMLKPIDITIELRIYQNNEVRVYDGDPIEIMRIMDRIITFDRRINEMKRELDA